MQFMLVSLGVLAALVLGLRAFLRANPATLVRRLQTTTGVMLIGFAVLLFSRGVAPAGLMLLAVAIPILMAGSGRGFGPRRKAPGQTSQIATPLLRMQLDHDSGVMVGEVLAGPFAGRGLATLTQDDVLSLLASCQGGDPQSAALLEAFLDHNHPDWRETAENSPGGAGAGPVGAGPLTVQEARDILGVGPKAGPDEIRAAWRDLMKRNHPDQGGSGYLAAKINQAKDVLLGQGT
jgi:hypothetical protein